MSAEYSVRPRQAGSSGTLSLRVLILEASIWCLSTSESPPCIGQPYKSPGNFSLVSRLLNRGFNWTEPFVVNAGLPARDAKYHLRSDLSCSVSLSTGEKLPSPLQSIAKSPNHEVILVEA